MSLLFANTQTKSQSGALVEFKAGRCELKPGSGPGQRKVVPLATKGVVYLKVTPDQLMHFCWKNRETNDSQLDLIVFSGDTEFLRMKEPADGGRFYMLKFKSSDTRHIFWMQDANTERDEETCKRVNELLANPPQASASRAAHPGYRMPGAASSMGGQSGTASQLSALQSLGLPANAEDMGALGNMDQDQLLRLISLMNGGAGAGGLDAGLMSALTFGGVTPRIPPTGGRSKEGNGGGGGATTQQQQPQPSTAKGKSSSLFDAETLGKIISSLPASTSSHVPVDLSALLSRANVQSTVVENAPTLQPHLPDQEPLANPGKELEQTVGNPQFRQAADFFGAALQTGKLSDALPHFGIGQNAVKAAQNGDVLEFAKELTKQEKEKKELDEEGTLHETNEAFVSKAKKGKEKGMGEGAGSGKDKKPDEGMDLD